MAEYRNQPVEAAPPGFADPFKLAVVPVRFDAVFVVTAGVFASVVKDNTVPKPVPRLLFAIEQK